MTQETQQTAGCPLSFDHYDYALQDDPYPVYARLGYEPICRLEMWERRT